MYITAPSTMKIVVVLCYFLEVMFCAAVDEEVTLLFVGDISFSGPVKHYEELNYHTYNDSFNEVAPYIRQADISVANLESPFVSNELYRFKYKGKKLAILDSSPKAAPALRFAGFDAVTVANNHFNDFGSEGANFTVEILRKAGVKYFGISYGKNDSSQEPLVIKTKGIKIGFLGYCAYIHGCTIARMQYNSGPAIYRDDIATRDVNKLKEANVDIIVVFIHWGRELLLRPLPYQLHIRNRLISLGVHIIIGAHPHVLQQHYLIREKTLVVYSLGNFLFPPMRPAGGNHPAVYGRLGRKPNKPLIKAYEHFTYHNIDDLKLSQMLKVTVSRNGVVGAKYLSLKLAFDQEKKRLHPEPIKNATWISVCGEKDKQCETLCNP